ASRRGARTVRGHYLRRVPLGVPLVLTLTHEADALGCRVADHTGAVLVTGRVGAAERTDGQSSDAPGADAAPPPVALHCSACGPAPTPRASGRRVCTRATRRDGRARRPRSPSRP